MSVRYLQISLAVGNCLFGLLLLEKYGRALLHAQAWPPNLDQQVLLLVAGSVLPIALCGLRFPLAAGLFQFSSAFIGNQLLHDAPLPDLRFCSSISMTMAFAILAVTVLRGILEVTREAFGEAEDQDEKQAARAA
jgi:hypothetical protein